MSLKASVLSAISASQIVGGPVHHKLLESSRRHGCAGSFGFERGPAVAPAGHALADRPRKSKQNLEEVSVCCFLMQYRSKHKL